MKTIFFSGLNGFMILIMILGGYCWNNRGDNFLIVSEAHTAAIAFEKIGGKYSKYYLLQKKDGIPQFTDIIDINYIEDVGSLSLRTGSGLIVFSVKDTMIGEEYQLDGLGYFAAEEPFTEEWLMERVRKIDEEFSRPSPVSPGDFSKCAEQCLSGGCGAIQCSRTVFELSCEITCSSGYIAC